MAPWSLKTVAKRLMGEEEQRVVPVNERSTERRKRTSETNLLATMGQEAPADLLRKLRGQKLSQKALDEKLLEVIIKLDALGASGEDVVGWESNIEGMDLDHERRSVLAERAPPSRDMATSPTAPADDCIDVVVADVVVRTAGFFRGPRRGAREASDTAAARLASVEAAGAGPRDDRGPPRGPGSLFRVACQRCEAAVARLALRFGVLDGLAAVDGRAGAGRPPSTDAAPVRW